MKLFKTTLTILVCALSVAVFAQNVKDKNAKFDELIYPRMPVAGIQKVKILVYPGPGMDLSQNDLFEKQGLGKKLQAKQDQINGIGPNWVTFQSFELAEQNQDATIEIAFGEFQQIGKQLKEHKIVCVRDDGKLDKEDIKECPGYYYEISYRLPVVVKITDASGNMLNAEHLDTQGMATFGYDDSGLTGYLNKKGLDDAFNSPGTSNAIKKDAIQGRLNSVGDFIQENFYFQEEKVKVDISSGGGKLDYTDLDEAQSLAINALENLRDPSASESILKAIEIWDNALKEADMNNKKARINRKVAGFVALNKAIGYYYMHDSENAMTSVEEAGKYLRFSSNLAHMETVNWWKIKISESNSNGLSIEKNKSLTSGTPLKAEDLMNLIQVKEKNAPYDIIQTQQKYDVYKNEYLTFVGSSENTATSQQDQTELDAAALLLGQLNESGTISWEDRMQFVGNMGYYINISYTKNETVPIEICELEMLNTLLANNAKITSVPSQIGQLKNLKTLNLASNDLTSIPEEIGQLENLKKLNLSKNQINSLPAALVNCKNLKSLLLKDNDIPQSEIDRIQSALPDCKIKL